MADIHYMTQEGLDKLKKDLAEALAQRPVISAAILILLTIQRSFVYTHPLRCFIAREKCL